MISINDIHDIDKSIPLIGIPIIPIIIIDSVGITIL